MLPHVFTKTPRCMHIKTVPVKHLSCLVKTVSPLNIQPHRGADHYKLDLLMIRQIAPHSRMMQAGEGDIFSALGLWVMADEGERLQHLYPLTGEPAKCICPSCLLLQVS